VGYAYHVEPTWLAINRMELRVPQLPVAFAGLRIAHLSDFHCGPQIPHGYLEDALARAVAEQPDVIALTGDYVDRGPKYVSHAAKLFRGLQAPLGVYGVLGNHDFAVHTARGRSRYPTLHREIADALAQEGVRMLRNEGVTLTRDGCDVVIAGVDDFWSGETCTVSALGWAHPDTPRVLLAHNPRTVEALGDSRADLVLSGHTHGGQINLPVFGRLLLRKHARRWAAGLYPLERGHLYVNTGVGFGWRFRFGVRPEIAVFTLQPA
jgi:hypothetical protein